MKNLKPLITEDQYRAALIAGFGVNRAARSLLPEANRMAALACIDELHGDSPCDRA